jgi:hypothetical protein
VAHAFNGVNTLLAVSTNIETDGNLKLKGNSSFDCNVAEGHHLHKSTESYSFTACFVAKVNSLLIVKRCLIHLQ